MRGLVQYSSIKCIMCGETFSRLFSHIDGHLHRSMRGERMIACEDTYTYHGNLGSMPTLVDKFRGCLLGGAIGDIVGAAVEAESPEYIARTYRSVDEILSVQEIAEFAGPPWQVGRFTDDTQMTLCVANWLIQDASHSPEHLLAIFAESHESWRRYGSGTEAIFRIYSDHKTEWRQLATAMFPYGSYGNGSAMRAAPIGLAFFDNKAKATSVAIESSRPTHSHPLAYQGAVLQSIAVAVATSSTDFEPDRFLRPMRASLVPFSDNLQDVSKFTNALNKVEEGIRNGISCGEMSLELGTGVVAHEAVPIALYCFLRHPESFASVIHEAVFIGGDTDTIACMAGAISGAFLGAGAIPKHWLRSIREDKYSAEAIAAVADELFAKYGETRPRGTSRHRNDNGGATKG